MNKSIFSGISFKLLIAAGALFFCLAIILHSLDNSPISSDSKSAPSSYSKSAIGHAGLHELLQESGFSTKQAVENVREAVGADGVLIMAEPYLSEVSNDDSLKILTTPKMLLVLPKWYGTEDGLNPEWVESINVSSLNNVQNVLNLVLTGSKVGRAVWPDEWEHNIFSTDPAPIFDENKRSAAQLIQYGQMKPLIASKQGILLGEIKNGNSVIWVLSEPDIMSNRGIVAGENGYLMLNIIDALRKTNTQKRNPSVVFDETVHGFRAGEKSPVKLFFQFPYNIVSAFSVLAFLILLFAGFSRFGAAIPEEREIGFGKHSLIKNSARLFDYSGFHQKILVRYIEMMIQSTANALHVPKNLQKIEIINWLDTLGDAKGIKIPCSAILNDAGIRDEANLASLSTLLGCAKSIHHWKGEMLNG